MKYDLEWSYCDNDETFTSLFDKKIDSSNEDTLDVFRVNREAYIMWNRMNKGIQEGKWNDKITFDEWMEKSK